MSSGPLSKFSLPFVVGFGLIVFALVGDAIIAWLFKAFNPAGGAANVLYLLISISILALFFGIGLMYVSRRTFGHQWTGIPEIDSIQAAKRLESLRNRFQVPLPIIAR